MDVVAAPMLDGLLRLCRWAPEQDFGYQWQLRPGDTGLFSLHLLADGTNPDAVGLLFARERPLPGSAGRAVLVHAQVSTRRAEALVAAALDDRGKGDLTALNVLLSASDTPAVGVPAAA